MIEKALNTLGLEKCPKCGKTNSKKNFYCKKCDYKLGKTRTSNPEDGLL